MLVSYAQNFEDIILLRALYGIENGFYIDIGANDPVFDSVSCAFYERGWRGMHVEPSPHYANLLREARPDETVIESFVSNSEGERHFFDIPGTGLGTGVSELAQQYRAAGRDIVETEVATTGLDTILDDCRGKDIHWLKIDVEGTEYEVLKSWCESPVRPWIVVVEATLPGRQIRNDHAWEQLLLQRGYKPVYFDGLNVFYLHESRKGIGDAFGPGPNLFDGLLLTGTIRSPVPYRAVRDLQAPLNARISGLTDEVASKDALCGRLEGDASRLKDRVSDLEAEIVEKDILRSRCEIDILRLKDENAVSQTELEILRSQVASLEMQIVETRKIALPTIAHVLRAMTAVNRPQRDCAGKLATRTLELVMRWVARRPRIKRCALQATGIVPPLRRRLIRFAQARGYGQVIAAGEDFRLSLDPQPAALAEWERLLGGQKRDRNGLHA